MGDLIQTVMSQCGLECLFADAKYLQAGFYDGFAIGLLVVLCGFLLILEIRRRRRVSGVLLHGANGDLFITANAVREFVGNVMTDFRDVRVSGAWIRRRRAGYLLKIAVQIPFSVEVPKLKEQIERHLAQCLRDRMGVQKPVRINITLRGYTADSEAAPAAPGGVPANEDQRNPFTGFPPQLGGNLGTDDGDY